MLETNFKPYVDYFSGIWDGDMEKYHSWNPTTSNSDMKMMLMNIGIKFKKENGMDLFSFYVVNESDFDRNKLKYGVPIWVVRGVFSWEKILNQIRTFVASCTGNTVDECYMKIRERMNWEFEGYDNVPEVSKKLLIWIEDNDSP